MPPRAATWFAPPHPCPPEYAAAPPSTPEDSNTVTSRPSNAAPTAVGAALLGRLVTVFESSGVLGGAAAYSGGQGWGGANHVAARGGIDDGLARAGSYGRGGGRGHPQVVG